MKAIILAAGRGSRMKDLTEEKPKCLIEFNNKPLLQWQIEALKAAGIREIGIVRGYKSELINNKDAIYFDNKQWDKTNMVMSLCCAEEWLKNEQCIVCYSDIIFDKEVITSLIKDSHDFDIVIPYNTNWKILWSERFDNPLIDAETFKINKEGILLEIGKRTNNIEEIQGQYMGIIKIKPNAWKVASKYIETLLEENKRKIDMTTLLNSLIDNVNIYTIPNNSLWMEFDGQSDITVNNKLYKKFYNLQKE